MTPHILNFTNYIYHNNILMVTPIGYTIPALMIQTSFGTPMCIAPPIFIQDFTLNIS